MIPAGRREIGENRSYKKDQLSEFMKDKNFNCFSKNDKFPSCCSEGFIKNEVIFDNKIDLRKYLKEIWICDVPYFDNFISKRIIEENNVKIIRTIEKRNFNPEKVKNEVENILLNKYNIPVKIIKKQVPINIGKS